MLPDIIGLWLPVKSIGFYFSRFNIRLVGKLNLFSWNIALKLKGNQQRLWIGYYLIVHRRQVYVCRQRRGIDG